MQAAFRIPGALHLLVSRVRFEAIVASHTADDLFLSSLPRLHGPIRVGQKGSAEPDDVGLVLSQDLFRMFRLPDLSRREKWVIVPLVVMTIWMGVYPQFFLRKMDASVSKLLHPVRVVMTQK